MTEEDEIQKIMRERGCSRKEAERRYNARSVAVSLLSPQLTREPQPVKPIEESKPKQSDLTEQKQRVLDRLEDELDKLDEQDDFFAYLSDMQKKIAMVYLKAVSYVAMGKIDYFILTVQYANDGKIHIAYELYKGGKKVEPIRNVESGKVDVQIVNEEDNSDEEADDKN